MAVDRSMPADDRQESGDAQAAPASAMPREDIGNGLSAYMDPVMAARVQSAIEGEHASVEALWQEHRRWAAAVILAHMPRDAELDDLLQEVAMTMVSKVGQLREAGAFKPWLRAVCVSVAKNAARKREIRKSSWLKLTWFTGSRETGAGEVNASPAVAEGRWLLELSRQLPEGYREPLMLKCVHQMSYRQIGEVLGLPETTIETRITRARRMLRELASNQEHEESTPRGPAGASGPQPTVTSLTSPAAREGHAV